MFITAKTLGDGQKTVILNADYIKSIEMGGIVHMIDSVKKYKTGADAIQRLLAEMFAVDESIGVGTQHFTREIARNIAKEDDDDGKNRMQTEREADNIKQAHKSTTDKA